jgi:concentrative nucleoside transporter, CNT family
MALKLTSLLGLLVFLLFAWLLSLERKRFPWQTVFWGLGLQFLFALFILKTRIGLRLFEGAHQVVTSLNASDRFGCLKCGLAPTAWMPFVWGRPMD